MSDESNPVFPPSPRVIYGKNPLFEVVAQVRFPPILRIDSELPSEFQEEIRSEYAEYSERGQSEAVIGLPEPLAKLLKKELSARAQKLHEFSSCDGAWKISLEREFVALTTSKYDRWEDFRSRLNVVIQLLSKLYRPAYFTRVGLRYRNAIRPSMVGAGALEWGRFLDKRVLGELGEPAISTRVSETTRTTMMELANECRVRLIHGLGEDEQSKEQAFVIDADFFTTRRTEPSDALHFLDTFNRESGHLFRWCITAELHEAMEPREVA